MEKTPVPLETIVSLAKRRGFIFPGSEIYGGLAGTFDYGPLGVALKKNIENLWWRMFVEERDDMYGIDAAILMNPKAWEASGHVSGFSDPSISCIECRRRFRVDQLIESQEKYSAFLEMIENSIPEEFRIDQENFDLDALISLYDAVKQENLFQVLETRGDVAKLAWGALPNARKYLGPLVTIYLAINKTCPNCNSHGKNAWGWPTREKHELSEARQFNMMFKTHAGATEDESSVLYLRPETAGGMFVNFKNVVDALHPKMPFGLAQIGKAFRNEIAPREFVFRVRELEQMEVEYFVREAEWEDAFELWRSTMHAFAKEVGIEESSLHELEVEGDGLAHYSERTIDFEFDYPFGRKELWGLAYRTDFDLKAHQEASTVSLEYIEEDGSKTLPHVIEPSLGVGRTLLAVLLSAYSEEVMGEDTRVYLKLPPKLAPIKAMVSPLLKNKPELVQKAKEVRTLLQKIHPAIAWDDNGNIGKRYRRQDEIGTPFCITIDFDTLGENPDLLDTVTLRHRDTGEQERLSLEEVSEKIRTALA